MKINIPGYQGDDLGDGPIVIVGPNGSGKTKLAQRISANVPITAVGAQRRTWPDDELPVHQPERIQIQIRNLPDQWRNNAYQPTEEINWVISGLIQAHATELSNRNEEALASGGPFPPVSGTALMRLQGLWSRLFPMRKLLVGGFFPKVLRLDVNPPAEYTLRYMSDGERTVLYMAARILLAEPGVILVDEPELHMHSRLSVHFWDEVEKLRPDSRYVYVTHDLNFALSRRRASYLLARSGNPTTVSVDQVPAAVATEVLGAATLPFFAKRIVFYEGKNTGGFAREFMGVWFDGDETFAMPTGGRDSVSAAVFGLKAAGVVAAEIIGLVDRDFYSDEILNAVTDGVIVLPVHEIESVLCVDRVVHAVAKHLGKDEAQTYDDFLRRVRLAYQGSTRTALIARRVRARVGDLLDGAFAHNQIAEDVDQTAALHQAGFVQLNIPERVRTMFQEETARVDDALSNDRSSLLAVLPGKHLVSILSQSLGLQKPVEFTALILRALDRRHLTSKDPLWSLGASIEAALSNVLPLRVV